MKRKNKKGEQLRQDGSGKGRRWFPRCQKKQIFPALIFAILASVFVGEYIIRFLERNVEPPLAFVEINVLNEPKEDGNVYAEVWITNYDSKGGEGLREIIDSAIENNGFEYREAEAYGYASDVIVNTAGLDGHIKFAVPVRPETSITFWKQYLSATVSITVENNTEIIDLQDASSTGYHLYFAFDGDRSVVIGYIIAYGLIYIFTFLLMFALCLLLQKVRIPSWLKSEATKRKQLILFLILSAGIFAYCVIAFPNLPDMGADIGDTSWYWYAGDSLFLSGSFSLKDFALHNYGNFTITERGYIIPFVSLATRYVSGFLNAEEHLIWFLLSACMHAFFSVYVIPGIYREIREKGVRIYQILLFFALYAFFWRGFFIYATSDSVLNIFTFLYAWMIIKYCKTRRLRYTALAGICAYVMINSRLSAAGILIGSVLFMAGAALYKKRIASKLSAQADVLGPDQQSRVKGIKRTAATIALFCAGFVVLGIPQALINRYHGVNSILPFSTPGYWWYMPESGLPMAESSMNIGLFNTQGFPHMLQNHLGRDTVSSVYANTVDWSINPLDLFELVYVYAARLGEMLAYIISKIFLAVNIRTCYFYPPEGIENGFSNQIFTFINYFVWINCCVFLLHPKLKNVVVRKEEKIMLLLVLVCLGVPQLLFPIEWRYFMPIYMMVYYIFSFGIVPQVVERHKSVIEFFPMRNVILILAAVIVMYSISETIYSNFFNYYQYVWQP